MKLMIASDIHGSKYFCEKLMTRYMDERPDKLILLGDLLYHGPRNDLPKDYEPKKVISLLNLVKDHLLCVRGNCDSDVDQMVLDFPIMSGCITVMIDGITMYFTHGHKYNEKNIPPMCAHDILIFGHTHVPLVEEKKECICLNPGSVSIPKENSPHSYMIYENMEFLWKDIEGEEYMSMKI
ncbi:MAG: phosphodiesterase [Clostridiales bacterium]|nr:phosphodiesterase [Clostridiales bacterium]